MVDYSKMSKEDLIKSIQLLEEENSKLRLTSDKYQLFGQINDSKIPLDIKSNLNSGNLVIPLFHFPHSYILTDMQGMVLYACPNMLNLFGYPQDYNYQKKNVFEYISPDHLDRAKQLFYDQKFYKEETVGIKANGERFYLEVNGNIIRDANGFPTNIVFLIRDINEGKKNEEQLQVLSNAIEQSPVTVVITDVEGKIEYANPKALETTGYSLDELIGQNPRVLKSGEMPSKEYEELWNKIGLGHTWHGFFHNKRKNGELYWESSTIAPVFNELGNIVRYVAIKEDVTEKKKLEEIVKNQNNRLNAILHAIPDLIFILNKDGIYIDYSAPTQGKSALLEADVIGKGIEDFFDASTVQFHKKNISYCIETNTEVSYEYRMPENGIEMQYEARLVPLDNEKVLALVRDVTEDRKISNELNQLSLAVTQSPVGVVITGIDGRIVFVNPAFQQITGYEIGEVYGKNINILKSGQNSVETYKELWDTITIGKVWSKEWINRKKDGTLYWESVTISPVFDKEGNIINYLSVKEDISKRKSYENRILDLNQNLEKKIQERTSELVEINENFLNEIVVRKKAEMALKEKSDELETFFEVTLDLLSMHDLQGNILKTNKAWEFTLGYTSDYLEGKNVLDLFHPDDIDEAHNVLTRLKQPGKVISVINRCQLKNGTYKFLEWSTTSDGHLIYAAGRDITERKRNEDFEMELLQLSTQLAGMPQNKMDEALNLALGKIGKFLNADRTYIFEFNKVDQLMSNTYEWCNEGVTPQIDLLQNLPVDLFPQWMKKLRKHENIIVPSIANLPDLWASEKEILQEQDIKSVMAMPMYSVDKLYGFVGIDMVHEERDYTESQINVLTIWNNILTNLMLRFNADKLLEITQRNFEIFFNTMDDYLSVIDKNGKIVHVNDTVIQQLSYTEKDLIGESFKIMYPQKLIADLVKKITENNQDESEFCVAQLKCKAENNISVETRLKLGKWNGETVVFCVSRDVSKLQLSEQKFSTVFELGSAIMSISDYETGEFIDVNNSFINVSGFRKEELIGHTLEENRLFDRNNIISKINSNTPVRDTEINVKLKNGEQKTALLSADAIYIGERKCLLTISVDITDRKKSEELLQWNKSLLELMSSSSPFGFLVVDNTTDEVLYFNKRFCQIWDLEVLMPQIKSGELKNTDLLPYYSLCLLDPEAFFESCKPLHDKRTRVVISDELKFVNNRTIRRYSTQIRGANDSYFGRFYIFEDITETKLNEEKLRMARFEAEKANEAKSEFLSRMSHELRTPLNSILGFAQLLEMTEMNEVQRKGNSHILSSGKHLLHLINEVLDISRIEAGRLVLSIETISVNEIITEIVNTLRPTADLASVDIDVDGLEDNLFIKSDRQSLKQILLNIVSNAIKYNNPHGKVTIGIKDDMPSNKILIAITDTGKGISKKNIARIFDPFERVGADLTAVEGTGLGLSVVKKLINALGSEVYVESTLGKGSKFWFELPKGKFAYNFSEFAEKTNQENNTGTCKTTVLYIEDNISNIELLEEIVYSSCKEISLFSETKGTKAIEAALNIKPDVILLDMNLPDLSGEEILKSIRKNNLLKDLPVIVVSANALPGQIKRIMKHGATTYITKPFDIKQIINIFSNI